MQDCLIKPIKLTEEEKVKLEQTMAECHQVLLNEAATLEERISTRRLRDEYRRGDREVSAEAQDALHILRSLEDRVLSGYILVGHKQSRKLFSAEERPGILIDDFHQEVAMAIYDCMYSYKATHRFTTVIYTAIRNRLVDFLRKDRRLSGRGRHVGAMYYMVSRLMNNNCLSFDQAIEQAQTEMEIEFKQHHIDAVKAALATVESVADMDNYLPSVVDSKWIELMREAVEYAPLSDEERSLINLHLSGEYGWQTRLADKMGLSRAAISMRFRLACDKCQETLESLQRKMAA